MTITLLNALGNTKVAMSPYEDGSFIFVNKSLNSLKEIHQFLQKNHTLSRHLNLREPIKMMKNRKELSEYIPEDYIQNIIFSCTEIASSYDLQGVIDYFDEKNYACLISQGTDYDGRKIFDVSVILKVQFSPDEETMKNSLMVLQSELQDKARVDLFASSPISVNPPLGKSEILFSKENGKILKNSEVRPVLSTKHNAKHMNISYADEFTELCLEQFSALGFHASTATVKDNHGFQFYRKYEDNTQRGYTFYIDNPLVMFHKDKNKQVSIYHLMKNTKEGKEWLKNKTKEEQAKELIRETDINFYKQYYSVNEKYLDFNKYNKKKMITDWLDSEKGVFKMKSPMGSAKSNGIDLVIKEAHKKGLKVILVSNRVSVAKDFYEKYDDMVFYQEPDAEKAQKSLIVQYDSLHRFKLSNYDIAIFDEYISLLLHHRGNLTTNSNINAVMFNILSNTKKVLIADAFLTGYEMTFFEDRDIWFLENSYKDDVKLFDYEQREFFITEMIYAAQQLKDNEHISGSFTSLNIIKLVEYELRKVGIKVISLTSETAETTRDIIYRKFKEEEHSSFQVILYTPTLTVGVSNLNNVVSHWHYDSSMGADVISSLQMIKRSRKAKEIHYFIQSRQNHFDTNLESLNINAQRNVSQYYNGKDKTLLVEMDYSTGEMTLTPLARYINKIEVFYNILANNHANAFRLLLQYQFKEAPVLVQNVDHDYSIKENLEKIKKRIRENQLKILSEFGEVEYTDEEIYLIQNKISQKTPEEKVQLLLKSVQDNFSKKIPRKKLKELARIELESGGKYIQTIKNVSMVQKADGAMYSRYELSEAVSSSISSLQSKQHIRFLENLIKFDGNVLDTSYTKLQVNEINQKFYEGKKRFDKFIQDLGYKWDKNSKTYTADVSVYNYISFL